MTKNEDPHASRRLEIAQLEIALEKRRLKLAEFLQAAEQIREKIAAQEAELRFQKLVLSIPYARRHNNEKA